MFIDFRERGRERETEREQEDISVCCFPYMPLTGNQTHNLGLCPDQEVNLQSFSIQDDTPAN